MATYVIGDVHGCLDALEHLLAEMHFQPNQDTLWLTGDLVNRGPQSLAVLRFVSALPSVISVLGNHDLYLLALWAGLQSDNSKDFATLSPLLEASDSEALMNWLRQRPFIHHDGQHALVHAGIPPQWTLSEALALSEEVTEVLRSKDAKTFLLQMEGNTPTHWRDDLTAPDRWRYIVNALTRMRFCKADGELELNAKGSPSEAPHGTLPWHAHPNHKTLKNTCHANNQIVFFGHWAAASGIADHPNAIALDTGCVWGNKLTGMRLEDKQIFQVPGWQS